jgi:XTP/dITP diphosphohydrolase
MQKIIVATSNMGKLREIREICKGLSFEITSLKDHYSPMPVIPEEGSTFLENAQQKARWVYSATKTWSLADDSGLEVDFLNGLPGVHSARYAGEHATDAQRIEKLLSACKACPLEKRTARFRCVVVFKAGEGDEDEIIGEGTCEGRIGFTPKGTDGFGYDPLFYPDGFDRTFAELAAEEKNAISHRGKALNALRRILDERFKNQRDGF